MPASATIPENHRVDSLLVQRAKEHGGTLSKTLETRVVAPLLVGNRRGLLRRP